MHKVQKVCLNTFRQLWTKTFHGSKRFDVLKNESGLGRMLLEQQSQASLSHLGKLIKISVKRKRQIFDSVN